MGEGVPVPGGSTSRPGQHADPGGGNAPPGATRSGYHHGVPSRVVQLPTRFWASERSLTAFLVLLLLTIFVLPPLLGDRPLARFTLDVLFCLLLVGGAISAPLSRRLRALIVLASVVALLTRILEEVAPSASLEAAAILSRLVSLLLLSVVVLAQVLKDGTVTLHRIQGAIAAYILFGLTWASAYQVFMVLDGEAFHGASSMRDLVYYSFVTLTTVGYGDVTPVSHGARMLAVAEALTGQLYPAILVARLVSLEVASRSGGP